MKDGYQFSQLLPILGRGFAWLPYQGESLISKERFSLDLWHKIVYDIDNDEQWKSFLKRYHDYCACYILYANGTKEPIAMCYILAEHLMYDDLKSGSVVSIHGGGWKSDFGCKFLYAKSWITLVHHLFSLGCKVLTNVKDDNLSALHLISKTGFRLNEIGMYEYYPETDLFWNMRCD